MVKLGNFLETERQMALKSWKKVVELERGFGDWECGRTREATAAALLEKQSWLTIDIRLLGKKGGLGG